MAAVGSYKVTLVTQGVYMDEKGKVVNGYALSVDLIEFGETVVVNVPTTDPDVAKSVIQALIKNRRALAALGE